MKKIVFLCILSAGLFVIFILILTSPTLDHPLGLLLLPIIIFGVGAFWALSEALFTISDSYVKPFLKKRFPKWA